MYEGCRVQLEVEKALKRDIIVDDGIVEGKVLRYMKNEEMFYIEIAEQLLERISLDVKYSCKIETENESIIVCYGTVKQRYYSEEGGMGIFRIENGFYKILID